MNSREKHVQQFGELPIGRLLLKFSIPAIIGMLISATYGIIDSIFVALVFGPVGLAAVGLSMPIMMIVLSAAMMIGIGTNTLISIRIGQNRIDDAEQLMGTAICMFLITTVLFTVFGLIYIDPLLHLFGADDKTLPLAKPFLQIIICGTLFTQISFGVNSFLRGEGKVHVAMVTMIIAALLNIVFSAIFLFVFKLGMRGPALATVIAQGVASVWIVWYYLSGRSLLRWRLKYIRFNLSLVPTICLMGLASCLMNLANSVLLILANYQFQMYGTAEYSGNTGIAVMRICQSVFLPAFMIVLGISQGAQPIIGYNVGAKRFDRAAKTLKLALLAVLLLNLFYTLLIFIFPHFLVYPFAANNPDFSLRGEHAVRIYMFLFPAVGFSIITSNYFQATGRSFISLTITMVRQVLILIPLYTILPEYFGFDGIWFATPISDGASAILCIILLFFEYRRIKILQNQENHPQPETL